MADLIPLLPPLSLCPTLRAGDKHRAGVSAAREASSLPPTLCAPSVSHAPRGSEHRVGVSAAR